MKTTVTLLEFRQTAEKWALANIENKDQVALDESAIAAFKTLNVPADLWPDFRQHALAARGTFIDQASRVLHKLPVAEVKK